MSLHQVHAAAVELALTTFFLSNLLLTLRLEDFLLGLLEGLQRLDAALAPFTFTTIVYEEG